MLRFVQLTRAVAGFVNRALELELDVATGDELRRVDGLSCNPMVVAGAQQSDRTSPVKCSARVTVRRAKDADQAIERAADSTTASPFPGVSKALRGASRQQYGCT